MSEQSPTAPPTVLIVGAGIAGLTTALALLQLHDVPLHIQIHERRSREKTLSGSGGIMVQENAIRSLRALAHSGDAVFKSLSAAGGTIGSGGFITRTGRELFFSEARARLQQSGSRSPGFAIMRSRLQGILHEAVLAAAADPASSSRVDFNFSSCLIALESHLECATARFENGTELRADLVIGADGINSMVRAQVEGNVCQNAPRYSGQTCWVGTASDDVRLCTPVHLARYQFAEYWGEQGRFGFFTAGPGELCWYAMALAERGGTDAGRTREILREMYCSPQHEFPAVVREIIETMDVNTVYRQDICDREPPPKHWGSGVVTLCGDAIHPMYNSVGQGACAGMEDAVALVGSIAKALRGGAKLEPMLRAFEAARTPRVTRFVETSRMVSNTALLTNPVARFLRDLVMYVMPPKMADAQFSWMYTDFDPPVIG